LHDTAKAYKPQISVEEQVDDTFDAKDGHSIVHTYAGQDGVAVSVGQDGNGKSLVGECRYMCPIGELLRREYENDIQFLEIYDPTS
jgi:hypothetical protein